MKNLLCCGAVQLMYVAESSSAPRILGAEVVRADAAALAGARAIVVDGGSVATADGRARLRRLLTAAKKSDARVALHLRADDRDWGGPVHDPMITAHYQSFLHLCDLIVGSANDVLVAGGSASLDEAVRLVRVKTSAALAIVEGHAWTFIDERGRVTGEHERAALHLVIDAFARDALRDTLNAKAALIELGRHDGEGIHMPTNVEPAARLKLAGARAPRLRSLNAKLVLVSTDLHGNLDDLRALTQVFESLEDAHWVITGDTIHGPDARAREREPELFDVEDRSAEVLEELVALKQRFGDALHLLVGAHEHGHLGGAHPRRFWPDEVEHLAEVLGERERHIATLFERAPLVLVTESGVAIAHCAIDSAGAAAELRDPLDLADASKARTLMSCLRSTNTPDDVVRRVLPALADGAGVARVSMLIHGHDEHAGGLIQAPHAICPVIFGARRENKRYALVDGARVDVRRLYP